MPTREQIIVQHVKPYLRSEHHILDIGAGNGLMAQMLHDATGADFSLLDVVDYNTSTLPMHLYSGKILPFEDNTFDMATLVFVLHHNPDPRPVMQEALRVSRHGVLVVENDTRGMVKKPLTRLIDSTEHLRRGVPPCYFTKSADEWKALFESLPARATTLGTFPIGWYWKNVILKVERA
jgi:ubiquinone/menaquinone biosynthesis C-methylase UbiE